MSEIFRQERSAEALIEPADQRIARLHRYYLARDLARGRDVLDIRAGDGSGAALLAQTATHVTAIAQDPTNAAADFPAVAFRDLTEGDSFDLIVAFDAIEHAADPDAFLAGLRARLRQGGLLLLATPDRGTTSAPAFGQHHHEFTRETLSQSLWRHFSHVHLLAQRGLVGSAMFGAPGEQPPVVIEHRGELQTEFTHGLRPDALYVLAAMRPIEGLTNSLFIYAGIDFLAQTQSRLLQAQSELHELQSDHAALSEEAARNRRSDADWRHELAVRRVNESAATTLYAQARQKLDASESQFIAVLASVQASAAAATQAAERRADALADAERRTAMRAEAFEAECASLRSQLAAGPFGTARRLKRKLRRLLGPTAPPPSPDAARAAAIAASSTFDAAWYRQTYLDVAIAGMDPATHYLRHGAAEDRNPNADFDATWFRAQHPELASSGLTPAEFHEQFGRLPGWPTRPDPALPTPHATGDRGAGNTAQANPRLLFVSGESHTPGHEYRCVRYAAAAREAGWDAGWSKLGETGAVQLVGVEIVVLWRVRYSPHVAGIMREVRREGGIVVFDIDDLMVRPELARPSIIDGMRTISAGVAGTRATFSEIQQTMATADLCITTTEELAEHLRAWQKATYILPNGFDDATHARSRLAVRQRALAASDRLIRIGYAAGTVTHQKDFAQALPGLLRVLKARPEVRLVLFRTADGTELVVVDEFEELARHAAQIEWRDSVALADLPAEIARFDINIAPLELGNPFCEAKSELKYFEAALVDVPTVASPTGPFARAIADGHTGLLAADDDAWHEQLLRLVDDAAARIRIGRAAYIDCLWRFGPRRRADLVGSFLEQVAGTAAGARAFALDILHERDRRIPDVALPESETLFRVDRLEQAEVSVIIPCFNYADFIIEALESVRLQTLATLDLIVIDDCSTDPLATEQILVWCRQHAERFNRLIVLRHLRNSGLSAARNSGFAAAETPFIMPLDADNRLHPTCCATLHANLAETRAAYAYPSVQMFGAADGVFCNDRYQPTRFIGGNYIDAMAMIAKWAWAAAGGYDMPRTMGWEDFDLWCRLAELGQRGIHVPEILADYRVHGGSMVASVVEVEMNKQKMVALIEQRHTWLRLSSRAPTERV